MINIFLGTDTVFTSQGEGTLRPLSCKEFKSINDQTKCIEEWYVEVVAPLKYKDILVHDNILVVPTKYKRQAFRIVNPEVGSTLRFKAHHVAFDSKHYIVDDTASIDLTCQKAMERVLSLTTPVNPFSAYSDIPTVQTAGYTHLSLFEAMQTNAFEYGGYLDFDNWQFRITSALGSDKGVELRYGKNLESAIYTPDWSEVITQLKPIGNNGLVGDWITSSYSYSKPYAKIVEFNADDASTLTSLAEAHLAKFELPKVNYKVNASAAALSQPMKIVDTDSDRLVTKVGSNALSVLTSHGDVLINDVVKAYARQFTVLANVLSYSRNVLTDLYESVEFGNYRPTVKSVFDRIKAQTQEKTLRAAQIKFDDINGEIGLKVSKNDVVNQINLSTEEILISANKIRLEGIVTANEYFKINLDGSMETIAGKLGNWLIYEDRIRSVSNNTGMCSDDTVATNWVIWAGGASGLTNKFRVLADGHLYAEDADISGTIHSGSGQIGGLTLANNALYKGNLKIDAANERILFGTLAELYYYSEGWIGATNLYVANDIQVNSDLRIKFSGTVYYVTRDANGFLKAV